jgi:hypothetical protein
MDKWLANVKEMFKDYKMKPKRIERLGVILEASYRFRRSNVAELTRLSQELYDYGIELYKENQELKSQRARQAHTLTF